MRPRRIHVAWAVAAAAALAAPLYALYVHLYSNVYAYSLQLTCSEGYTDGFLVYAVAPAPLEVLLSCAGHGDALVNVTLVGGANTSALLPCNGSTVFTLEMPELTMVYVRVKECRGVRLWVEARLLPPWR